MKLINLSVIFPGLATALPTSPKLTPSKEERALLGTQKRAEACMPKCQRAADKLQDCNYMASCQGGTYWWRQFNDAYNNCCRGMKMVRSDGGAVEAFDDESSTAEDPAGSPADYVDPIE